MPDNIIDDLSLQYSHIAYLAYKDRNNGQKNFFPEPFMNLEIILYNKIRKDNSFYVLKDSKNKKLIFTFPGTRKQIFQLLEEFLGSSLNNFHINNKNIIISLYFGEKYIRIIGIYFLLMK